MNRKNESRMNHTAGPSPGKILDILTGKPPSNFYRNIGFSMRKRPERVETAGISEILPELTPTTLYLGSIQKR